MNFMIDVTIFSFIGHFNSSYLVLYTINARHFHLISLPLQFRQFVWIKDTGCGSSSNLTRAKYHPLDIHPHLRIGGTQMIMFEEDATNNKLIWLPALTIRSYIRPITSFRLYSNSNYTVFLIGALVQRLSFSVKPFISQIIIALISVYSITF